MAIEIVDIQDRVEIPDAMPADIEAAVAAGLAHEGIDERRVEVSVALVDDERILDLNRRYRGVDSATDVLSFAMDDDEVAPGEPVMLGDVIISMETVSRESGGGEEFVALTMRLAIHGLLHLLGYDHEAPGDAADMERREDEILRRVREPGAGGRPT